MIQVLIASYILRLTHIGYCFYLSRNREWKPAETAFIVGCVIMNVIYMLGSIQGGIDKGWVYSVNPASILLVASSLIQSALFLLGTYIIDGSCKHR